ncbi:hypothetical protein [Enterococcus mundtii]|uniref:hypothetical protein n=1 Tax=Enterococcus mundtii TaxID=53346 RepID=UPI0035C67213
MTSQEGMILSRLAKSTAKDGTITAEYGKIDDTKTRTIVFKVKVNEEAKIRRTDH